MGAMGAMGCITVCPRDLRFTQDSIAVRFQKERPTRLHPFPVSKDGRIDDAVRLILAKELCPSEFPTLRVVRHGGLLWSTDNRRLWVFRKANVPEIAVQYVPPGLEPKRFAELKAAFRTNSALLGEMSSEHFYPRVRGQCIKNFQVSTRQQRKKPVPPRMVTPVVPGFDFGKDPEEDSEEMACSQPWLKFGMQEMKVDKTCTTERRPASAKLFSRPLEFLRVCAAAVTSTVRAFLSKLRKMLW